MCDIILCSDQLQALFPNHVVIDAELKVIQTGRRWKGILTHGRLLQESFHIKHPISCDWDWDSILDHKDIPFRLELLDLELVNSAEEVDSFADMIVTNFSLSLPSYQPSLVLLINMQNLEQTTPSSPLPNSRANNINSSRDREISGRYNIGKIFKKLLIQPYS